MAAVSSFTATRLRVALAVAILAAVCALPAAPALAYTDPNGPATPNQPATFLPAPNPGPYCDGTDYFGYIDKNKQLTDAGGSVDIEPTIDQDLNGNFTDDSGDQRIATAQAFTQDSGGTTLTFTSTNYVADSPKIYVTTNAPIGITLSEDGSAGNVSLSQPLFYSQWVFTDVDLSSEGFTVQPAWSGATGEAAVFGGDANYSFGSTTASSVTFNDTDAVGYAATDLENRVQVDFLGAIDGLDITKLGAGGAGFMVGGGCPAIGASTSITTPVWDATSGTFTATHTIKVANNLPSPATLSAAISDAQTAAASSFLTASPGPIDLSGLGIVNPIDDTGFSAVSVANLSATGTLAVNNAYDGTTDTQLLTGASTVAPEQIETITFDVTYTPDPDTLACSANRQAQATASGTAGGTTVTDDTDNGLDPSPIAVNTAGTGTDDPSTVVFATTCSIAVTKTASTPVEVSPGVHEVTYELTVANDGERSVAGVGLADVLTDDFAAASGFEVLGTTLTDGACTLVPDGDYTGAAGQDAILTGTDTLAPTESCTVELDIRFTSGAATGPFGAGAAGSASVATDDLTDTDSVAFTVVSTAAVEGTVSSDVDNDLAADQPVVGATVTIADGSSVIATTTTDDTGAYVFTGLTGGDYTISAALPADHRFVADPDSVADGRSLITAAAGSTTTADFLVEPFAASDDRSLANTLGSPVSVDVSANDASGTLDADRFLLTPGDGSPVTSIDVAGEGTWTIAGATVTFTPLADFESDPTPISYRVGADVGGPTADVTIGYIPVTNDIERVGVAAGSTVTVRPLARARGPIDPSSLRLVDPVTGQPVLRVDLSNPTSGLAGLTSGLGYTGTGTWAVDPAAGTVTFTPGADFDGDPPTIDYRVLATLGGAVTNVIIIEYAPPARPDTSTGNEAGQPVTVYPLANDGSQVDLSSLVLVDPATGTGVKTLVVAGEGTWTVGDDGGITFTPDAGFTGDPTPVTYRVTANNGSTAESTVTISYASAPPTTPTTDGTPDGGDPDSNPDGGGESAPLPLTGSSSVLLGGFGAVFIALGAIALSAGRRAQARRLG